jgi:hypothetical protein
MHFEVKGQGSAAAVVATLSVVTKARETRAQNTMVEECELSKSTLGN